MLLSVWRSSTKTVPRSRATLIYVSHICSVWPHASVPGPCRSLVLDLFVLGVQGIGELHNNVRCAAA